MQVEVDVKCMKTTFGGCGFLGFGDIATFQIWPNFLFRPWTISIGSKIEFAQKINASSSLLFLITIRCEQ